MTSTSGVGATLITLQFDLERSIDAAAQDVQQAINAASGLLPKDLPSPRVKGESLAGTSTRILQIGGWVKKRLPRRAWCSVLTVRR